MKICAVVTGKNLKEFLANLKIAQRQADWVELRADYINSFSADSIPTIKKTLKAKAIFTCRKKTEGGKFQGAEVDRIKILKAAVKTGFNFIDIEFSTISKLNFSLAQKKKIICSYHDFKKTPSLKSLGQIYGKMNKTRAGVIKIVTMCSSEKDSDNLLNLLAQKEKNEKIIVLGMGEKGKITRLFSPLLGGFLTFASIDKKTAPGQMTVKELKKIYRDMGINS